MFQNIQKGTKCTVVDPGIYERGGRCAGAGSAHAKKFFSERTVWESCYKLVVTPQMVSVFTPIDLTKWNLSYC